MSLPLFFPIVSVLLALVVVFLWWRHWKINTDFRNISTWIRSGKEPAADPRTDLGRSLEHDIHRLNSETHQLIDEWTAKSTRLESTLDQISDGILIISAEGKVSFANPSARSIFPYRGEMINAAASLILRHHDLIQLWQSCQTSHLPNAKTVDLNFGKRTIQVFAIPDTYQDGAILHIRDLTDLRKTESIRRDFVSNISHELRTPLASIKALAETMLEYGDDDPVMSRNFTQNIIMEVDALSQMAAELLELTKIESGQVPFDFQPIDPHQLLERTLQRLSTQIERAGLAVTIESEPDLPLIAADAPRLEQVLVNLLHNAIKFTPSGGKIRLTASHLDQFVRLSVIDNGIGIPEEKQARVFERFYRTDSARTGGGTGLGLSIAKHIVESHHGTIEVKSTEGQGSEFSINIPIWVK